MEPRTGVRGRLASPWIGPYTSFALQWSRGPESAEGARFNVDTSALDPGLQWSRGPESAEGARALEVLQKLSQLQWSRGPESAEGRP